MSNKREYYIRLYDFYGSLLTQKQQTFFHAYYEEDYSLQEIGESEGISRAAVSDALKHCRKDLENYEHHLHLLSAHEKRLKLIAKMKEMCDARMHTLLDEIVNIDFEGGKSNV